MFENIKNIVGKAVKDVMTGPAAEKLRKIVAESIIPFVMEEFKDFSNEFTPKIKEKIKEKLFEGIKDTIKKELTPEFDNKILNSMASKISDTYLDLILPTVMGKLKEDFFTEEFFSKILSEFVKKL